MTESASNWIDAKEAPVPDEVENILITGFIENDPAKGRFYAVAHYIEGVYYNPETGDDFYPPTHWATIYAP
jgi:hypothetical protein